MSSTTRSEDDIRADEAHIAALADELATLASNLFAGEARFVRLIGDFDRLDGWADGTTPVVCPLAELAVGHRDARCPGTGPSRQETG